MTAGRSSASSRNRSERRGQPVHQAEGGRTQFGFGLMEAIIGMVMVALLIGAGATGLQTLQNSSTSANQTARLDALLVGASEALKKTAYQECAEPASGSDPGEYGPALAAIESASAAEMKLAQTTSTGTPTFTVTDVQADGCETAAGDAGRQEISIEAEMNGTSRTAVVVKVDPNKRLHLPKAAIDQEIHQTSDGDLRTVYALTATDSSAEEGLLTFLWDCGVEAVDNPAIDPLKTSASDPMICEYESGAVDRMVTDVKLTVTDRRGQTDSITTDLRIPMSTDPRKPPIVEIVTPAPGDRVGPASFTVQFSATATARDGSLDSVEWDFGDLNTTADTSDQLADTYTYDREGDFTVTFTATADGDLVSSDTITIQATDFGGDQPIALLAEPREFYYAPSVVDFDSTGSTPEGGDFEYEWDYGDGSGIGTEPFHEYQTADTYAVKLTVTNTSSNREASAVKYVTVKELEPPSDLRAISSESTVPCAILFGFPVCVGERRGHMTFGWKTIPDPDGEIEVNIRIIDTRSGNCWTPPRAELRPQDNNLAYQTFRWNGPNPRNGSDSDNAFCWLETYRYEAQTVRTYQTPAGVVVDESTWGQPHQWSI